MSSSSDDRRMMLSPNGKVSQDLPCIAAAFLVVFDMKIGYTIAWKRSLPDVQLDGVVEYKALPSGLHNVKEDLVYFIHDGYAAVSAFVNSSAAKSERNASLVTVGILVPLSYGRLGRSWEYAEELRDLATTVIIDISDRKPLEDFWERHKIKEEAEAGQTESPLRSPTVEGGKQLENAGNIKTQKRTRVSSDAAIESSEDNRLPLAHPALSIGDLLPTFGPLIFPLYRAALLRKRILLVGTAPVQMACNFVYDLSLFSNIPISTADILPLESESLFRIRPLFSLGVHDVSYLESLSGFPRIASASQSTSAPDNTAVEEERGWIACTTDEVLGMKRKLYDIIVKLPSVTEHKSKETAWPQILTSDQSGIKATPRDLRRYQNLRSDIIRLHGPLRTNTLRQRSASATARFSNQVHEDSTDPTIDQSLDDDHAPLLPVSTSHADWQKSTEADDWAFPPPDLIEPTSWSALAYDSFIWWASAGERSMDLQEEQEQDHALFASDLGTGGPAASAGTTRSRSYSSASRKSDAVEDDGKGTGKARTAVKEMGIIAYFHRLTHQVFEALGEIIADADAEDDDTEEEEEGGAAMAVEASPVRGRSRFDGSTARRDRNVGAAVVVTSEDLKRMGLDEWSEADRAFVRELVALYWGREVEVRNLPKVECCGIRIA